MEKQLDIGGKATKKVRPICKRKLREVGWRGWWCHKQVWSHPVLPRLRRWLTFVNLLDHLPPSPKAGVQTD